jgi:hypothetical protein
MLRVHERRVRRLGGVVPFSSGLLAARVLGCGYDLKILVFQVGVDFLPAWQIEAAASPGGPGDDQHFLAAEVGEMHHAALPIGHREVRRHARVHETST